jgi:hypothetical protein
MLKCDLDFCRESTRISKSVKADRDLLIYIFWQLGVATNQEIGEKFGLTYSAVSQWVRVIKVLLNNEKELEQNAAVLNHKSRFDTNCSTRHGFSLCNVRGTS